MDKLERIIKKALLSEQIKPLSKAPFATTSADWKKFAKPTTDASKDNPLMMLGPKANLPAPVDPEYADRFGTFQPGLRQKYDTDINDAQLKAFSEASGQPAEFGAMTNYFNDVYVPWPDNQTRNKLISLGGLPFLGNKGTTIKFSFVASDSIRDFINLAKAAPGFNDEESFKQNRMSEFFPGGLLEAFQLAMYQGAGSNVGTFIQFFNGGTPDTQIVYLSYEAYQQNKFFYWSYEPEIIKAGVERGTLGNKIWLGTKPEERISFIEKRSDGSNTVVPANPKDGNVIPAGLKQDNWIANFQQKWAGWYLGTAFKSIDKAKGEEPMIWQYGDEPGDFVNLTALADRIQTAFDWIGIPFPPVDIINAIWYISRGRWVEGCISIIAFVPVIGDAIKLAFKGIGNLASIGIKPLVERISLAIERIKLEDANYWIREIDNNVSKFIETAEKIGLIPERTVAAFSSVMDDILEKTTVALENLSLRKRAAEQAATINTRLGVKGTAQTTEEVAKKSFLGNSWEWLNSRIRTPGLLIKDFPRAVLLLLRPLYRKSDRYIRSVYIAARKKFLNRLLKDKELLAITIISFSKKDTRESIAKQMLGIAVETGILQTRQTKRGIVYFVPGQPQFPYETGKLLTQLQQNPRQMLDQIQQKSVEAYSRFAVSIGEKATVASKEIINPFWDYIWSSPWNRFLNEYIRLGSNSLQKPGATGVKAVNSWTENFIDEISRNIGSWWNNDIFKKLDVIYNELQEYFEQKGFGPDEGSKLSNTSVVYTIIDEAWYGFTQRHIIESQEAINTELEKRIPSLNNEKKFYEESVGTGFSPADSIAFQLWVNDTGGDAKRKIAYMSFLTKHDYADYLGNPSQVEIGKQKFLKLPPGYAIWKITRDNYEYNVKAGELYVLNLNTGVMGVSAIDPETQKRYDSWTGSFSGFEKFAQWIEKNPNAPISRASRQDATTQLTIPFEAGKGDIKKYMRGDDFNYEKIKTSVSYKDLAALLKKSKGGLFRNDLEAVAEAVFFAMSRPGISPLLYKAVTDTLGIDAYQYVEDFMPTGVDELFNGKNSRTINDSYKIIVNRLRSKKK